LDLRFAICDLRFYRSQLRSHPPSPQRPVQASKRGNSRPGHRQRVSLHTADMFLPLAYQDHSNGRHPLLPKNSKMVTYNLVGREKQATTLMPCKGTMNPPLTPPRRGIGTTRTNACSLLGGGGGSFHGKPPFAFFRMHWDHEPERVQCRAGVPPARRAGQRERFCCVGIAD